MEKNNTEIELFELFVKTLFYFKKYFWIFIVAIVLSVSFTFINSKMYNETFISSMLLKVNEGDKHLQIEKETTINSFHENENKTNYGELITRIINTAEILRANRNFELLAKRMNVDAKVLNKIISISVQNNNLENKPVSNYVTITVTSTNKNVFQNLETGFVNFISSNKFVKSKFERDTKFLNDLKNQIERRQEISNNNLIKEDIIINEKILLNLKQANLVELVEEFYLPNPSKYYFKKAILINVFISLFLAIFIVFLLVISKKMKDYKS